MRKKIVKAIPILLSLLMFGMYQGASRHDNGIPLEITSAQQDNATKQLVCWTESLAVCTKAMDDFSAHPNLESEMMEKLTRACQKNKEDYQNLFSNPAAFSPSLELSDADSDAILEAYAELDAATERLTNEITRSREDKDFEIDQSIYSRLATEVEGYHDIVNSAKFCDPRECFWCKCRKHWKMDQRSTQQ